MLLPLNLAMTPTEIAAADILPEQIAWMACHFSPAGQGLVNLPIHLPEGAILILDDSVPCQGHSADVILQTLDELVTQFHCNSLLLDFQRPANKETMSLVQTLLRALPCPVAVPPEYAEKLPCPVFLPPPPLHLPLGKYLQPWAGREIWLEAALCQQTITVSPDGTTVTPTDTTEYPNSGFFDKNLCCRYLTKIETSRITFTLFDTPETLQCKLDQAQSLGVTRAVGLYQELGTFLTGK